MIRNAYVIMTALVPTTGHADLIDFASRIAEHVFVVVQGREIEPVSTARRLYALQSHFKGNENITIIGDVCNDAPQNPTEVNLGDDVAFWTFWASQLIKQAWQEGMDPINPKDAFVASEPYGEAMAKYIGCRFIPYDIKREINNVKGTGVRHSPFEHWNKILPEFRKDLQANYVLFGQESVGKTTIAKSLTNRCGHSHSRFIPEYARGYLEAVGSELSDKKMQTIEIGQNALQQAAFNNLSMVNFFDTDLLSTIGYYRIFENRTSPELKYGKDTDERLHYNLVRNFKRSRDKMHYILLPDDIAFEEDPLRYGGDQRQSSYEFWKDLLFEYKCTFSEVPRGLDFKQKVHYILDHIVQVEHDKVFGPITKFERE